MSLKFSATTHSFRIGGWTNSDGNTALSSWNVFFFRKEIQWFEIKSKRASATADRWNNCRLLDEVFLFKFFLLFLFCFEREHDSSTCHDPIESSRADRAGRRDRENVHAPLVCFGFLFFLLFCFVCVTAVSNRCYAQPQRLHEPGLSGRHGTAKLHLIDDEREFAFFFAMFVRYSIEMRVFFMNERSSVRWDSTGRLVAV